MTTEATPTASTRAIAAQKAPSQKWLWQRSIRDMLRSPLVIIVLVVTAWFIVTFLIVPNITLLGQIFFPDGSPSGRAFEKLLSSERAMRSLLNSFILAVSLSVTVNVVGIFIVLVTRYFAIRGSKLLWVGYATALIYGGVIAVSGYKFMFGSNGFVTKLLIPIFPDIDPHWFQGPLAVIIVMTFAGTGQHMLFLSAALAKVDYTTIEAAKMMGASAWTILRRIVLPTIKPMIFAITILTFLGGLSAFAAPQVLGGTGFQTISPMILTFAQAPSSRDLAAVLALALGLSTLILLFVLNRMQKGGTYFSVSKVPSVMEKQKITSPVGNVIVHAIAYLLFAIYVIPPLLIVVFSFTDAATISSGDLRPESFTLANYVKVFTDPAALKPLLVSVCYGAICSLVVVIGVLFIARIVQRYENPVTAFFEYLLHIPWVLPATLLALGLIVTFSVPQALVGGTVLTGTVILLGIAFVSATIPFTLRLLKAAFIGVPDSMEEAATILGASSFYTFRRVLLPLVLPTAAAITALNFNSLLTDYDSAVFLAHPLYQPLGIVIQNATKGEGTLGDATALSFVYTVIVMILAGTAMWAVYGRSTRDRASARR
ncbi:ABC transporter permease [Microbacterium gorillae]|uniref:ABC transporter permease n=1 Tax=Microbacterium gorillae TaxID=1231063 RepID=UPI000AA152AC|nr:iron ABC transporter permease [Microbacterium gorillae]